ncbi:siderophore-interacting protein [Herbiconiux moechotypicola]|uniref:Siderophore-interacting protein n=1 Tax=Herbiconiux moechotypicola TaxID=637393 RepID=A0ABP5Q1S4_9MICO|nr:siderophore-interacting protein [Herbiconiux moechotypicola]MCS5728373.1 siderophore-interacting protein [Herbiconiux moechotypicola]
MTIGSWTAETVAVHRLGPHLVRVELGGAGLGDYVTNAVPDESVTLYFPRQGETAPPAMTLRDGEWGFHDLDEPPVGRNYTIRSADPEAGTVAIDFVLHGDGVASQWAARATPGDGLVLWRQRGWYRPPAATDWVVLAADLTGLPAVLRILEGLPDGVAATVLVDALDDTDLAELRVVAPRSARIDARLGAGNGVARDTLIARIEAFDPPASGDGYAWFAGEAGDARRARAVWRERHGLARDRVASVGYWRADATEWQRRYATVQAEMEQLYADAVAAGATLTEAGERVEDALALRGL